MTPAEPRTWSAMLMTRESDRQRRPSLALRSRRDDSGNPDHPRGEGDPLPPASRLEDFPTRPSEADLMAEEEPPAPGQRSRERPWLLVR